MFDTLQPACYGIVSIFFALSTITILLRLYSRGFVIKSVGWDDWCMLAILFFNCGHQAILYYFIHYGGGLHIEDVMRIEPQWITHLTYALFAEELYYAWMHFVIKMAFLLFYLRFATKTFRTLVYCTIAVNVIFTVLQWLLYCFQCIPLEAFFDRAAHPTVKCLDNKLLAFLPAACSIFTDACIVVLPIHPLWTIQVSLRKRIMLIGLVSLGGIVVLISCLRLSVLLEFQKMTDFTYSLGKIIIISSIELEVAIMAANAPALKIFFSQALNKRPGTRDGATNKSHNLSDMSRGHLKHNPTFSGLSFHASGNYSRHITTRNDKDDSSESLTKDKTSILVTSSIGVESHEISSSSPEFGISSHYEAV